MEELFKEVSESSKKLYIHNLKKLNGDKVPVNLNFLKNTEKILTQLEGKVPNTRKSYLIAIVKALKMTNTKPTLKLYDVYYPYLVKLNQSTKDNTEKTESETTNWITKEDIDLLNEKYSSFVSDIKSKRKITDEQKEMLLEYLIFSLYTKTIPRRGLDYTKMKVANPIDSNPEYNYYWKGKFYFNNYKTKGTYGSQIIDVPLELETIIKLWIKHKNKEIDYLLVKNEKPFVSTNYIQKILTKIFGKNVGVSLLRKYYATSKHSSAVSEMEETSYGMGNSVGTLKDNYIKKE